MPGLHNVIFGSGGAALAQIHLFTMNSKRQASWCSGSTSDSKSDNGGSIPSEVTFWSTECDSPMAQSVARQAVNLQVAGSNPAGGDFSPPQQSHVGKSGHRESNPGFHGHDVVF